MTRSLLAALVALLCLISARPAVAADPAPRPNIIVILTDDVGYSDLGCMGSEIQTPNLDKLAADGLRFTQFYNTARCCPTRAALLTGVYSHQASVGHMVSDQKLPGFRGDLGPNVVTFAEALRPAGYGTYMVGKWHVTPAPGAKANPATVDKHNWPRARGFDRLYGTIAGAGNYFAPNALVRDDTLVDSAADAEYKPDSYYYTDAIADHAVKFIGDHDKVRKADPLLMYVAFTAGHWPLHARPEDIAKYKGKYDAGYEAVRDARLARMKEMKLVDPAWEPSPGAKKWADVKDKAWEARCMEVYAAQLDRMDQGVGRIVAELERTGRLKDTLILYMQDNGACAENIGRNPDKEGKSPPMPGPGNTHLSYGQGWANVSNVPFREYKHWVHEGGISTPLIAHWPAGITRKGEFERQPSHLIDVMATCLDVAGAQQPKDRNGVPTVPVEGRSLRPAFAGQPIARAEPIFFEHEGNRAVRDGDWKLVAKGPKGAWELYDMKADRTEMHDVASANPDKVKAMAAQWQTWAKRANVLPWPWKDEDGDEPDPKKAAGPWVLKAGETLAGAAAPAVGKKPFKVTATVAKPGRNGVIVAQGGTAEGFTLYLKDGKPAFAVRVGNALTTADSPAAMPEDAKELTASLAADGTLTLAVGDKQVATAKAAGTLNRKPKDGLSVGSDSGAAVGAYEAPFPFDGTVGGVKVELTGKP